MAHPTPEQRVILARYFGVARMIWNAKVDENTYYRRFKRSAPALVGEKIPVDQCYSQFRSELTPWLKEVPSQLLRNTASRWYASYQRFWEGQAGRPRRKKKGHHDSILLTKDIFQLRTVPHPVTGKPIHQVFVGARQRNAGWLEFEPHRRFGAPNSVTVSRTNGKYYVSFAYADGSQPSEEELIDTFAAMDAESLTEVTVGIDRGVVIPFCTSAGEHLDFTPEEKRSLTRADRRRKRAQRKLARQCKGSHRRERTKRRVARQAAKAKAVRQDRAHKISRHLADSPARVFAVERLQIKNLTRRPTPKLVAASPEPAGAAAPPPVYAPNGARAKAGLTRKILTATWGLTVTFLTYKALRLGKLVVTVPPQYSSQECARCGFTTPSNRESQSRFVCHHPDCTHVAHADENAAQVIKKRGVQAVFRLAATQAQAASDRRVTSGTGERLSVRKKKARGAVTQSGIVIPDDRAQRESNRQAHSRPKREAPPLRAG